MNDSGEKIAAVAAMYGESPPVGGREHRDMRQAVEASHRGEASVVKADASPILLTDNYWAYVGRVLKLVTSSCSSSSLGVVTAAKT